MKKFLLAIILVMSWPFTGWGAGAFIPAPKFTAWDSNGDPLSGGKVYTYECGTSTPKTTYSDRALGSANANPVVLDSRGEADIYQSGCLKIILKTSADVTIYTVDNFGGVGESFIQDADGDTIINVEESTDEDIIRLNTGGTERATIDSSGINLIAGNNIEVGTDNYVAMLLPGFVSRPKFTWTESLDYDGGTVIFVVGETVTGAGAGTGVVVALSTSSTVTSGTLYLDTRNATAFVNDEVITGSGTGAAVANQISSKNSIVISPFVYYHNGTTGGEMMLYTDTNLTYEFAALATSDWSYLYIDDSTLTPGTSLLTIGNLTDAVTEPATSAAKHGEYNGQDKCIFGVLTDGSDNILEFFHNRDYVSYGVEISGTPDQDIDNAWEDLGAALTMPSFSIMAKVEFRLVYGNQNQQPAKWRTNGSQSSGHIFAYSDADVAAICNVLDVITDSGHQIELYFGNANGTDQIGSYTMGWYFPTGM